ncbi:putative DNA-binding transcriptional regulator YafY [Virgibacillus halotolerans]|uniref:hypothetical protein n=1 Tax=Virgibacillus halotolerans TaxID=1071053 RepID=UPI001960D1FF|nr:hypothetical protein [Virgibacillus halotolerans]MBM7601581.1 putative DNA-binding transcriptional regulator YafY [Virgibacillus halotolerans]
MMYFMNRSLHDKEKIMIYYMDSDNRVTQRIIRVIQMEVHSIVAFCYYRRQIRTFRLNNILSVGPTKKGVGA